MEKPIKKNCRIITIAFFLILLFAPFIVAMQQTSLTGLAEQIPYEMIGRKLDNGIVYNPDENMCIIQGYKLYSIFMIENINNGKKTIVYVADNKTSFKNRDSVIAISSRSAKELGENTGQQIPVKVTLLKESAADIPVMDSNADTYSEYKTAAKQSAVGSFYVQTGSFKIEPNANAVKTRLVALGYNVTINKIGNFYKVYVGPYQKFDEAQEVKKILEKLFPNDKPFVITR